MAKNRELVCRVTAADCEWEYFRAGGPGGQKQNKTNSACRVRHLPSGAVAESRQHKEQIQNRREAWKRLAKTPEFELWAKKMASKLEPIEKIVERQMAEENLYIEVFEGGLWHNA